MRSGLHIFRILTARSLAPGVAVAFLLLYIAIAFISDEALVTIVGLLRDYRLLSGIIALIPLNLAARLVAGLSRERARRALLYGKATGDPAPLFQEVVIVTSAPGRDGAIRLIRDGGYTVRAGDNAVAGWRGFTRLVPKAFFVGAVALLVVGMLLSVSGRETVRVPLVAGEPLPPQIGRGRVAAVRLQGQPGLFLDKSLGITVAGESGARTYGLYPPGLLNGRFLYPRYLGLAPLLHFSAPGADFASYVIFTLYPPGREDSADVPGTDYRIYASVVPGMNGADPFVTEAFDLRLRVVGKGGTLLSGTVRRGESLSQGGVSLGVSDLRNVIVTDMIRDPGLLPVWGSIPLFAAALLLYLASRIAPRSEILIIFRGDGVVASSYEECRRRQSPLFHRILDLYAHGHDAAPGEPAGAAKKAEGVPPSPESSR